MNSVLSLQMLPIAGAMGGCTESSVSCSSDVSCRSNTSCESLDSQPPATQVV